MDSHQLITALHNAQQQSGGRPADLVFRKATNGKVRVDYNASADSNGNTSSTHKPKIIITHL